MKYSYLLFLLLLQACVYELPETGRQPPNEADLEEQPTKTLVIVDYYNPNPVVVHEDQPISEVVIDYHPEEIEIVENNNTDVIQPISQAVVETIPVVQEPIIVLPVSSEPEITANVTTVESNDEQNIKPVVVFETAAVTPVIEELSVPEPAVAQDPESVNSIIETLAAPEPVVTIVEPEIQKPVEVIANTNQPENPVITITETVVKPVDAVSVPEVIPVKEEFKQEEQIAAPNPIIETPVYPQIPLISSKLIPEETRQIVSLFVFYASLFNKSVNSSKLIIEIETAPSSFYIAYCSKVNNNKNPKIKMNRQVWGSLTPSYREMLLFHELGHCLLNRPHQGNDFYNPTSIMNSSLFSDLNYKTNYDYFIKELFGYNTNITEPILFGALYEHIH